MGLRNLTTMFDQPGIPLQDNCNQLIKIHDKNKQDIPTESGDGVTNNKCKYHVV